MADVTIDIGGRRYDVTCRDGEEERLRALAAMVEEKAVQARAAVGGVTEVRQLLLAALLLADELSDLRGGGAGPPADPALTDALERLAARVESVADQLENRAANA